VIRTSGRKTVTVGLSESAHQGVTVLAAELTVFVAVSGINCHRKSLLRSGPGRRGLGGLGSTGAWRGHSRRAYFGNEAFFASFHLPQWCGNRISGVSRHGFQKHGFQSGDLNGSNAAGWGISAVEAAENKRRAEYR
jgi:hypothetical protein